MNYCSCKNEIAAARNNGDTDEYTRLFRVCLPVQKQYLKLCAEQEKQYRRKPRLTPDRIQYPGMNYITEYNNLIQAGKIVVSRRVKQVYAVLRQLTAETSGQYIFDETRANRPIAFIERFCKHSKGEWAGRSISLELFQKPIYKPCMAL